MRFLTLVAVCFAALPAWAQDNMGGAAAGGAPTAGGAPAARRPFPIQLEDASGDGLVPAIVLGLVAFALVIVWLAARKRPAPRQPIYESSAAKSLKPSEPPPLPDGDKPCPDCAEKVKADARVCRFCGYRWPAVATRATPKPSARSWPAFAGLAAIPFAIGSAASAVSLSGMPPECQRMMSVMRDMSVLAGRPQPDKDLVLTERQIELAGRISREKQRELCVQVLEQTKASPYVDDMDDAFQRRLYESPHRP